MGKYWQDELRTLRKGLIHMKFAHNTEPFVVLFVARTGSNLLAGMLDTHPQIVCHHELFSSGPAPHRSLSVREGRLVLDLGTAEQRDRDPIGFLSQMYQRNVGAKAVGFKMALSNQNIGVLLSLVLNNKIRKIILRRDNWLQVYTSALIADKTNNFIEFADKNDCAVSAETQKVIVEPEKFITYQRKRWMAYGALVAICRLTRQKLFELSYEQINDPEVMRHLLQFLSVDSYARLRQRTVKQNSVHLRERIVNYEDLLGHFRGTRYERYLVDDC